MAPLAGTIAASSSMVSSSRVEVSSNQRALDQFLRGVERRALRMAEFGCGNRDDALDMVQDAMCGFVRHYADKPESDWAPLFYRVLDSRLNDFRRRRTVRSRWLAVFDRQDAEDSDLDPIAQAPDTQDPGPLLRLAGSEAGKALDLALKALPLRQRQAFLLRLWEGFDVATTARVMQCSEGSVKTHLSRALAALRRALEDHQ
jgi:RNA polymerase sigma-70 factor (ECF subfamily)